MKKITPLLLLALAAAVPSIAAADDYGCRVLMCMANPDGPTAVEECRPPIERLHRDLAKGRGWPSCDEAKNKETGKSSYVKQGYNYFDDCPAGTKPQNEGVLTAVVGQRADRQTLYVGIGNGENYTRSQDSHLSNKICVAGYVNTIRVNHYDDEYTYEVYQKVETMRPYPSPHYIDVYIDNKFYRRNRNW